MDRQVKPRASRKVVRIGGASGFWGDSSLGPVQLVREGGIDYLVFDYLAELTMSILAGARMKRPEEGYATDFVTVALRSVLKQAVAQGIRIVSNAGGVNPRGCAAAVQALADELGVPVRIAIVTGDDVLALAPAMRAAGAVDLSSGDPLPEKLVTANAYLGALPIARALDAGADIVITGRCVDSAVTLGVLLHEFSWAADDFDRLAAGSLAGHIIECGCQATGGLHTDWAAVPDWANIGYPIVECHEDGSFILTKPPETGGLVTPATVGEQLLYEIGDPASYLLPDVTCDFRQVRMEQAGLHRVLVTGARGRPPTGTYKVSATAAVGFKVSAQLTIVGIDAAAKAKRTGEALLERGRRLLRESGAADFLATHVELLGTESAYGPHARPLPTREVVLRLTVTHADRQALEMFSREFAAPGTSWSPGTTGVGGRPSVAPVLRQFAFLMPKEQVDADGHDRRHDLRGAAAASQTAGRAGTAGERRRRAARRPAQDRAARADRVRAQRRQGRHLQHRPDRAPSGAAGGAHGAGNARTRQGVPPPPRAGAGPPLRAARHPRHQPGLRARARRRRHGLVAQRSARQGHGADAARHAGRGARKPAARAPRMNFDRERHDDEQSQDDADLAAAVPALLATPLAATAWERGKVETFATLPPGEAHPEGIAMDREGNVYVVTVAVNKPKTSEGTLLVFDPQGKHLRTVQIKGSSRLLLDLGFHPQTGKLLVIDYKDAKVLSVDPEDGCLIRVHDGHGQGPRPRRDDVRHRRQRVRDRCPPGHHLESRTRRRRSGRRGSKAHCSSRRGYHQGIGANGLAFNNKKTALFVANTANDTIVKIPVTGSTLEPGTPEVFVNRVGGGPDGLIIDEHDNLWIACNQSNEILVLEPTQGQVIAKLGDFGGIDRDGAPIGFLWSNSLVFHGDDVLVTNLSFDLGAATRSLVTSLAWRIWWPRICGRSMDRGLTR